MAGVNWPMACWLALGGGVLIGLPAWVGCCLRDYAACLPILGGIALQITLGMLFLMFGACEWLLPESGLPASLLQAWWWHDGLPPMPRSWMR